MKENEISLFGLTLKAIVAHTLTYFLVGFLAFMIFDYAGLPRPKCGRECTNRRTGCWASYSCW